MHNKTEVNHHVVMFIIIILSGILSTMNNECMD